MSWTRWPFLQAPLHLREALAAPKLCGVTTMLVDMLDLTAAGVLWREEAWPGTKDPISYCSIAPEWLYPCGYVTYLFVSQFPYCKIGILIITYKIIIWL